MKKIGLLMISLMGTLSSFAQPAGWNYMKYIRIQENSGTGVSDYQLRIEIDTQTPISLGQMESDGRDIRFGTDCNVIDLNDYWIESGINTPATVIWVKLDTLPPSGTRFINMFYGNPSATSASSIGSTFWGPHSSTDSVDNGGAGGVTNSQRGFRFYPNEDILVTDFGKREPTGSTRYITLFENNTQAILRQMQVSGPAAAYSYQPLANPVWLTQGTQYILEMYQGSSDGYYFGSSTQIGQHLTYLDMRYCNGCTENTFPTNYLNMIHYGYPDMWYYTRTQLNPAPTYSIENNLHTGFLDQGSDSCERYIAHVSFDSSSYLWNNLSTTQDLSIDTSGIYYVSGTTLGGCLFADTITVTINSNPVAYLGADTLVCNTVIILDAQNPGAFYLWNDSSVTQTINTSITGNYSVLVTDSNGCKNSDTIMVVNASLPSVSGSITPATPCYSDSAMFTGTGGITYLWIHDTDTFSPGLYPVFDPGAYIITGTDTNGCSDADTIEISIYGLPVVQFTTGLNVACLSYGPITLSGGTPGGGVYSGTGVTGNSFDPSIGVGTYILSYTYTDMNGCTSVATDDISVLACMNIQENEGQELVIYPNPSTGNLTIETSYLDENTFIYIYNILGEQVYNSQLTSVKEVLFLNVQPGTYIVEITNESGTVRKNVIIQ